MRAISAILAVASVGTMCQSNVRAAEDVTTQYLSCYQTKDPSARLACYDKIGEDIARSYVQSKNTPSAYPDLSLLDLKVDKDHIIGKPVSVSGQLQIMGDLAFLKSEMMDMSPVFVDVSALPRDTRKAILEECAAMCSAIVRGRVSHLPMGTGVIAEEIALD